MAQDEVEVLDPSVNGEGELETLSKEDAINQGMTDGLIEELGRAEGDITLDDLRKLPGADKLEDAELQKLWDEANKEKKPVVAAAASPARGWKFLGKDGKEIADIDKLTVADFLSGKISYKAMNREQQKTVDELLRVAQYGHLNETKLGRATQERDRALTDLRTAQKELGVRQTNEKTWKYALSQFALGNEQPLAKIIDTFKAQLGTEGVQQPNEETTDAEAELQGQRVWYEELAPRADDIAQRYGAKSNEVRNAVQRLFAEEQTLTRERIDEIIDTEIPLLLEQAGYREGGAQQQKPVADDKTVKLEQELATLKTQMANINTERVRVRNKSLPPASGGRSASGVDDASVVPADVMKDKNKYKKWLKQH